MPTFDADALQDFTRDLFRAGGLPADEAERVARSLVLANLCGHDSHGVIRVLQYLDAVANGLFRPGAAFDVLRETPALIAADGGWGLGQVQAHRLLDRLVPKAKSLGVAAGTLRRCGHVGRLGEYAEAAVAHGLAFLGTVNNHGRGQLVAPPGGTQARISTNPLCLGAPTVGEPLVLDIGTSVCAEGKVRVSFQKGEPVPEGWLIDADGRPTTDPGVLYREPRGSILPLGGPLAYKGFGLGLMLDLFAGALSGGYCSRADPPMLMGNAVLFVLFDPAAVGGADHFLREAEGLTTHVRGCPRLEGADAILLPGDIERQTRARRQVEGVALGEGTWQRIAELANKLGVPPPDQKIIHELHE